MGCGKTKPIQSQFQNRTRPCTDVLKDAARKLSKWKPFILNWHKHCISTGKLEVINSKIGSLQRNAYGYRDDEYLKLRIFNLHRSTDGYKESSNQLSFLFFLMKKWYFLYIIYMWNLGISIFLIWWILYSFDVEEE